MGLKAYMDRDEWAHGWYCRCPNIRHRSVVKDKSQNRGRTSPSNPGKFLRGNIDSRKQETRDPEPASHLLENRIDANHPLRPCYLRPFTTEQDPASFCYDDVLAPYCTLRIRISFHYSRDGNDRVLLHCIAGASAPSYRCPGSIEGTYVQ